MKLRAGSGADCARCFIDRGEPLGGRIGRAVIDVDDLVAPAAVERGRDLGDQRRHIVRPRCARARRWKRRRGCVGGRQIDAHRLSWLERAGTAGPAASRRPLLMGRRAAGNPFEVLQRGSRQAARSRRRGDREAETAGGEPVAHRTSRRSRRPARPRPRRSDDAPAARGGSRAISTA